ncbi:MAG TPA: alpha-2-macroglobulin family protein, partial [Acidobacteriota bacterium]|nr:alpha-2-macroglobulin family protein [Acidobacteriota bacterium]
MPQIEFYSAGPDSRFSTQDDIVARFPLGNPFRAVGVKINQAIQNYDQREPGFLATFAALKAELKTLGVDFDALRDHWGHPYRLEWQILKEDYDDDSYFSVIVKSAGPNGRFELPGDLTSDDFTVWAESVEQLDQLADPVDDIGWAYHRQYDHFPRNHTEWNQALRLPRRFHQKLIDPWGRPFLLKFEVKTDRVFQIPQAQPGHSEYLASFHWPLIPTGTMYLRKAVVSFSSSGPDRRPGTTDDFIALTYEEPILPIVKLHSTSNRRLSGHQPRKAGLIAGILTDGTGVALAEESVEIRMDSWKEGIKARTDVEGKFQFVDLQPGLYSLNIQMAGYRPVLISNISVIAGYLTPICQKIVLQPYDPSTASEVISVTAGKTGPDLPYQKGPARSDTSQLLTTPRIRKDFPETLYWLPELVTDQQGRAQVQFPVADAMTTWKCAVIATTLDGRQAMTQTDVQVTQPFFVEADLPSHLTEGDIIHLPVVVRNYLPVPQTITVELKLPPEVRLVGQPHQQLQLQANTSTRLFFQIRAEKPLTDGRVQIIARGSQFSDAVEQPFSVRPDGPEILQTVSRNFTGHTQVEVVIPASARKTQSRAELKLYPNAISHVLTCLTGMLQQPYGCAEQTISTTIPNLLLLHYLKLNHIEHHPQEGFALHNLQAGYQRLLQFQHNDGGFGYFPTSSRDMALTAYVMHFLQDAQSFVVVDRNVLHTAGNWLLRQQKPDGSWAGSPQLTGYIARMLTQLPDASDSVERALQYLSTQAETTQEAYPLAQIALAAQAASHQPLAQKVISRLKALAIPAESAVFWNNPQETLFFGYGKTGRLETTALALEALGKTDASSGLIGKGWLYLLENKDFYGGWYSTYATAQTLRALQTAFGSQQTTDTRIKVLVNGEQVTEFDLSARNDQPMAINLAEKLTAEHNTIELQQTGGQLPLTMQVTAPYFLSWESAKSALTQHSATRGKLTLKVGFSQTNAPTGTPITCAVDISRQFSPDAYHHGMYLAEIGLPPGAIVDRESLNRALQQSSGSIHQYELQPGRVIFYLNSWNHQAQFTFSFSLKFPLTAQSMPFMVYDYYNPEEQVTV